MSKQKAAQKLSRQNDGADELARLTRDHDRLRGNLRTGLSLIALLKANDRGEKFDLPHKMIMRVLEGIHMFFDDADSASEDLRGLIEHMARVAR